MSRIAILFAIGTTELFGCPLRADDSFLLREELATGTGYRVSNRSQFTGQIRLPVGEGKPARSVAIQGTRSSTYLEELLPSDSRFADRRTLRMYEGLDYRKTTGDVDQPMKFRPSIRQLIFLDKQGKRVPFSPGGPLTWGEIELFRTEMFVPALLNLLPGKESKPLDTWKLSDESARDLTDLEKVDENSLKGQFIQTTTLNGRRVAELAFTGSAKGVNEDGPTKHTLRGTLYFDMDAKAVIYLSIVGEQILLDAEGKETGKVDGRFVMTREPRGAFSLTKQSKLAPADWEPGETNTRLLFESEELGVSFHYPRRWHVGQIRGKQITLDEPAGSGVLLTVESTAQLPAPDRYFREVNDYLGERKIPVRIQEPVARLAKKTLPTTHFTLEAREEARTALLDYYIVAGKGSGATVAGRTVGSEADTIRREISAIVESLRFRE